MLFYCTNILLKVAVFRLPRDLYVSNILKEKTPKMGILEIHVLPSGYILSLKP